MKMGFLKCVEINNLESLRRLVNSNEINLQKYNYYDM